MIQDKFTITEDHLKLLRKMNVEWGGDGWGSPRISSKRPYGNSDIEENIHFILTGGKLADVDSKSEESRLRKVYEKLHFDSETVLHICLSLGTFETGDYVYSAYKWWKND